MSPRSRIRWTLATTALAIALSASSGVASSPSPGAGGDAATPTGSSAVVAPAVAALPTDFTWEPLPLPKRKLDDLPWMVVGAIPGERTLLRAYWSDVGREMIMRESRLWTSDDGGTWQAGKDGGAWMGGNGYILGGNRPNVAAAWLAPGTSGAGVHVMAFDGELRTSPDGQRWTPVKWPKKLKGRFWGVAGVVPTPDGFLAVGQALDADIMKDGKLQATAFTSKDGKAWTVTPIAPAPSGAVRGLAAAPDGTVVATGYTGTGDAAESVLWVRDPDGTWSSIPVPWSGSLREFAQLGHAAGRFFLQVFDREAVDGTDRYRYTLWTSTDGRTWETGETTGLVEPSRLAMAVGAIDGGVLLVTNPPEPGPKVARWSPDWVTWTESTIPDIDDHYVDASLGRLHDGRPVLLTMPPDLRSKANGLSIMVPLVATPVQ